MRRHSLFLFSALSGSLVLGSCSPKPATVQAPPDYTGAQKAIWSGVPDSLKFGLTAASAGHLLDRAVALDKLIAGGPKGHAYLAKYLDPIKTKIGLDPLDPTAWKQKGIDLQGPLGFFMFENGDALFAARPIDAAKARVDWPAALGEGTRCTQSGELLYCGDTRSAPVLDAAGSIWPRVSKELTKEQAAAEIQLFVPLEKTAPKEFGGDFEKWFAASRSAFFGVTLADDEIHLQGSYLNPRTGDIAPYLPPIKNEKALLGAAEGSRGAARIHFSPRALFDLAKTKLGADTIDKAQGAMLMATGLDLQKDIAENLTGEIMAITYEKGGLVEMFGTSDDERTKKLVERLDSLCWGGIQTMKEMIEGKGWKVEHRTDTVNNRSAFVFAVHLPKDVAADVPGGDLFELHLASGPGAFFIAFDKDTRDRALASLGKPPTAFLSHLRKEAQAPFVSGAPMAFWGEAFNLMQTFDYTQKVNDAQKDLIRKTYGAIDADLPDFIFELSALGGLIYDGVGSVDVAQDRLTLDYRITLL